MLLPAEGRVVNLNLRPDCPYNHPAHMDKARICPQWENNKCIEEERCRFTHGDKAGETTSTEERNPPRKREVCRHWQRLHSCKHGEQCRHFHK